MSSERYVYLCGELELHYVGDPPGSQPPAGHAQRHALRVTLDQRTHSRARLRRARILPRPYDPAELQATSCYAAGNLSQVLVELPAQAPGQQFHEDLSEVYVTDVTLHDVMCQSGRSYGTLRGTGYAKLLVPATAPESAPNTTEVQTPPPVSTTSIWQRLPGVSRVVQPTTGTVGASYSSTPDWPDWFSLGRVLRYLFLGWLILSLSRGQPWGLVLLGLLLWRFLSPILPDWLGLGSLLRIGGGLLAVAGVVWAFTHGHHVLAGVLGLTALLMLLGGRAAGTAASLIGSGLRLVFGLASLAMLALAGVALLNTLGLGGVTQTNDATEATGRLRTTPPPRNQPPTDSLLMSHQRHWPDLRDNDYEGHLDIAQNQYYRARQVREQLPVNGPQESEAISEHDLYGSLFRTDAARLPLIYAMFDSIGRARGLDREAFAQMVVTCVQDIPYSLVHQYSCDEFDRIAPALRRTHDRKVCQANIRFGVQTPAEFMYNLKGDCDTRALFLYTVLRHFGYDVAVLTSSHYSHAVLGLAQPTAGNAYVEQAGQRYYAWETTATGFPLGMLAPQVSDMRYWQVAIH
jgi:hypothetical protein